MPADYASTARALSLSTSPDNLSPTDDDDETRPPWGQSHHAATGSWTSARGPNKVTATVWEQVVERGFKVWRRIASAWERMNWWQRVGAVSAALASVALGLAFMFFTGQVFIWLGPVAGEWEKSKMAAFVLWLCVFFVSFPPLVGWSTFGTMAGFIFGVWKG